MSSIPLLKRLEIRFDRTDTCWLWIGKVDQTGYGSFNLRDKGVSRTRSAHKIIYETLVGLVPEGMQLDHLCRVRLCVNPDHLEVVTPRENTLRSEGLTALNAQKTHCKWGHPFDESNTYHPPKRLDRRYCRACQRMKQKTIKMKE